MNNPKAPLLFSNEGPDEWFDWLLDNYSSLEMEQVPHYVLIVGSPQQVPFHFQSLLSSAAAVGRVSYDSLDDLDTYVKKILKLETMSSPVTTRDAIFFAPDAGLGDATYFSRRYMAEPMAETIEKKSGLKIQKLIGDQATKGGLVGAVQSTRPALVYTASHGLAAPSESLAIQKRYNGAICCQPSGDESLRQRLYSTDDVLVGEPFLEGSVFFQFACYGYGTPAESDFMHWLNRPTFNSTADFVAALPKRLLAQPGGPIAFIGHVDTAWLHGFDDPESPHLLERWHPRIEPFVYAVLQLLETNPVGLAMSRFPKRYDITNAQLTSTFDRLQRGSLQMTPTLRTKLAQVFITRSDAQNYMIFGDPAVRLRIPAA
jgi:hypothetical protein